jgi:hypothetical protein
MERPEGTKSAHQEVRYEEDSQHKGKTCSRCEHFIDSDPARCETVASPIAPTGWCERFELDPRKLSLAEYREYREKGAGKKTDRDSETEAYREVRNSGEHAPSLKNFDYQS